MKTIFLERCDADFTVIPNHILRRSDMSRESRFLLIQMLSLPKGWETTMEWIIGQATGSRAVVRRCVKELEVNGYLVRSPTTKKGKKATLWKWYSTPQNECRGADPDGRKPPVIVSTYINKGKLKKQRSEKLIPERWTPACNLGSRFEG